MVGSSAFEKRYCLMLLHCLVWLFALFLLAQASMQPGSASLSDVPFIHENAVRVGGRNAVHTPVACSLSQHLQLP